MSRGRNKRGMGALLKEMRTSPVAAAVNGVLGFGGILGAGLLATVWIAARVRRTVPVQNAQARQSVIEGSVLLYMCLGGLFLLGGIAFLLFALVQITASIRVFDRGMIRRRFGSKRVIRWEEVDHFGPGEAAAASLTSWRMVLHNGEVIVFHSGLYSRSEFAETMELIAEQIEVTHKQYG